MDNQEALEYIQKVRNGDDAAFAFLVDGYKKMAYAISLKILEHEEEAEDAAQESFIKAYQQLHQFEGKAKFSTWLYTIVYRTALAKSREMKLKTFSITDQFKENFTNDYVTPQLTLMQTDDLQRSIRKAIDKLPKSEALLVILYYIDENSIKEIQQITGMSIPNIKINLFRARKKLERVLRFLLDDSDSKSYGRPGGK
jgi:RNA polymerase sigma-70 factor (ECF subfamily)